LTRAFGAKHTLGWTSILYFGRLRAVDGEGETAGADLPGAATGGEGKLPPGPLGDGEGFANSAVRSLSN
jgi:hypothetical protein